MAIATFLVGVQSLQNGIFVCEGLAGFLPGALLNLD
jgi:hypothetical protein